LGGDESQQFLQSPSNARGVKKTWKMFPRTASVSEDNVAPGEDERHSASPSPGLRAGEDVRRRSSSGRSLKTTTEEWFASAVKNAKDGMSGLLASNKTESSNRVHPLPTLSRRGELACDQSDYPRWLMVSDIFKEAQEPNRTAETDAPHRLERTESVEKANKLHRQRTKMTMSAGLDAFSASMDGGSKEKKKEERLIDKIINDCQRVNSKTWNRSIQQLCVSRQTTRPFWKAVLRVVLDEELDEERPRAGDGSISDEELDEERPRAGDGSISLSGVEGASEDKQVNPLRRTHKWETLMEALNMDPITCEPKPLRKTDGEDDKGYDQFDLIDGSDWQGPMGESPIHVLFLLSYRLSIPNQVAVHALCKEFASTFYCSPEKISTPFRNNMDFFIKQDLVSKTSRQEETTKAAGPGNKVAPGRLNGTYTGETVLHIAIVNRDTEMAKWLLERGAKIDSVANGDFFYPSIIRRPRFQTLGNPVPWMWRMLAVIQQRELQREPVMRVWRNEDSAFSGESSTHHHLCYFGEVPLSFAASMGCIDICDMLKKRASNEDSEGESYNAKFLNYQDSFGNSAMHMAVFHRRKEVFDWLMKNDGKDSLEELNQDGLTPFTLAARLGHIDIWRHILQTSMTETVWKFGNVSRTKIDLRQLDTYRMEGGKTMLHKLKTWRSAFEVIVQHEVSEFYNEPLFKELLSEKWRRFGRRMHLARTVGPWSAFVCLYVLHVILRTGRIRHYHSLSISQPGSPRGVPDPDFAGVRDTGDFRGVALGTFEWLVEVSTYSLCGIILHQGAPYLNPED